MKKITAAITAVGHFVPDKVLDNKYFEQIVDTTDEWITTRTGIKERTRDRLKPLVNRPSSSSTEC